jgi:hypothetical protein
MPTFLAAPHGPGRPRLCQHLRALGVAAALQTFRSSGPDTEQRPAMLTLSVQEYDIADVRLVFGKGAE